MAGVVAAPSRAKRGRSKVVAFSDFFGAKVKTLLLRTQSVVQTLPAEIRGSSVALLTDLGPFADAGSLQDVLDKLGGEETLVARVFVSVTDESERRQLDLYARQRQGQQHELILKELHFLVGRVQQLAQQLPKDPLVEQVLALTSPILVEEAEEDDDEAGTGEQEESVTKEKKKPKPKKKKKKKKHQQKEQQKIRPKEKRGRSTTKKSGEVVKPVKQKTKKGRKEKEVVAAAVVQEEEEALVEEPCIGNSVCEADVLRLVEEAEREFGDVQKIAKGGGSVPLNVPLEGPPDVEQLIRSATLTNVIYLFEQEVGLNTVEARMSLQGWWRTAKRACQIHGLFQLLRHGKSKSKTLRERYALLTEKLIGGALSFIQASRYDRIGAFLAQFPLFVYQRKWTTVADWFVKVVDCNDAVLVDCLASIAPLSCVFLKDVFSLHEHGFMVIPGLMSDCISDKLIAACKAHCEKEGEVVFNNAKKPESRHNDKKRVQLSADKIPELAEFKRVLSERLAPHFPRHKVDSMVALLSKMWCKSQLSHTDFTPETLANATDDTMPLASLSALMDGTLFDVWLGAIRFDASHSYKPMQIKLNKGDVLIFRGDLVHAGAAVGAVENVRIHAYLDVEGVVRPKHKEGDMEVEKTYFMCDEKNILKR